MSAHAVTAEEIPKTESVRKVVRFLKGANLLGQAPYVPGNTLVEHAEDADVINSNKLYFRHLWYVHGHPPLW